ncbi:hypothetical protein BuS5_00025 [Desulfosarcina sp. BuS5]|uniref:HEPN domain-containing protein n=1 Tax=Desulfosarcina sp. BuS5 TaxID=933262 RepID=UPI000487D7BA|nr:HEPN domain-containing protein [Desulfosarcina sp. BuS5]WDN87057.1 hypothetical protein BuS5_00025 [Desulfosarcina sp. BuS5]
MISKKLLKIKKKYPLDLIVYTKDEWAFLKDSKTSFIQIIEEKGINFYMKDGARSWMAFTDRDLEAAKIHSVVRLYGIINEKIELKFTIDEDHLNLIDDIYIDTRYPSGLGLLPSGFPSKEEAIEVLNIAKNIYDNQ